MPKPDEETERHVDTTTEARNSETRPERAKGGPPRRVTQIAAVPADATQTGAVYALCDDGTLWALTERGGALMWIPLPDIPKRPTSQRWDLEGARPPP